MIQNRELTMDDYLSMLRRRAKVILIPALVAPLVGFLVSYFFTPKYTSQSLILVEGQKVPENMVQPVVSQDLAARMATLQQQVMSQTNLQPVVDRVFPGKNSQEVGQIIDDIRLNMTVEPVVTDLSQASGKKKGGQGTAGKLLKDPTLYDEAHRSLVEMRSLLTDLNAGKGTAGKLVKDEELYRRLDDMVAKFNTTIDKINSGQGTLGQFMVNPQLYEALTGTTREFQSLAKDMRANPKKFLTIRLTLF